MSLTWSTFRAQIRRSVLKDTNTTPRWSDALLLDCVNWALNDFTSHTAVATATSCAATSRGPYTIPDNIAERLEHAGQVYLVAGSSTVPSDYDYLNPVRYTPGIDMTASKGYYEWPTGSLYLLETPSSGATLYLRYFAYYNEIVNDNDVLTFPRWARMAIGFLTAAYALSGEAVKSANIRQWAESPERGDPEDNSFRQQQKWFVEMYERELSKHPAQDRENLFRDWV